MMAWARRQLDKTQLLQGCTHRGFAHAHAIFLLQPGHQILDPPAHHAMHGGDWALLNNLGQGGEMFRRQLGGRSRGFPFDQTWRTFSVKPQHPVPDDLKRYPADPGSLKAFVPLMDRRKGQQAPGLFGIARAPGQIPQRYSIKIIAKRSTGTYGKLPVCQM